jgi:uncharacterized protein YegP (UPF0339 family)
MGAVKFEVFMGPEGKYIFKFYGKDGSVRATSKGFQSKDNCMEGIRNVKENAQGTDTLKKKTLDGGKLGFTLCMPNRQVVLEGGPFDTAELCEAAMVDVRLSPQAVVIDRG